MNENRRAQYLEAMGIETYVPRWLLPNALAPVPCELAVQELAVQEVAKPDANSQQSSAPAVLRADSLESQAVEEASSTNRLSAAQSSETLSPDQVTSLNEGLSSVLAELSGEKSQRKPKPKAEAVQSKIESSRVDSNHDGKTSIEAVNSEADNSVEKNVDRAAFNLGMWFTDTRIQVLDSRQVGDALPTEAFLSNLLVSNGLIQAPLPRMETQVWPFPGSNDADQGWDAACSMMSDFFEYRFEASPALAMLACGEEAAKALLGADVSFNELCFQNVSSDEYKVNVFVLPALRDFLYQPELKREIWPALTELRTVLTK